MASGGKASNIEVFPWLKTLPLAPEYHPTLAEFQDPIGYIFKIEKEASKYGICKIVPPVHAPPKKTAISNLNRSLAARSTNTNPKSMPAFTTRQQQIGFCPRKHRPVQKPVWQSGETYTLPQFEAKAKAFEKNYLKKITKKVLTPLEVETLYWKATVDKPFSVEYANDMPGSAFAQMSAKKSREAGESATVGETAWNMRGVSRAKGSLLRFMKEEIPGVTSPMVYVAMMFSWFAWHVEDHDLHSLNYMHMGAGKTWYGVPREAAVAFEEVIRVHGYGGEINPIVTFATLGEKTTVMSPEVLLSAGIPCCRLVQNAGEFVVTFPRAYHSGFSHGFNCAEAANIATPEWLRVANDAAVRRASINCPPMVSHIQLLYDLALSLSSRMPASISHQPRSSRLKDKKKGEGEALVKELFIQDVMKNNDLFHVLGKGSPIVLLPRNSLEKLSPATSRAVVSESKVNPRMSVGLRSLQGKMKNTTAESLVTEQGIEKFVGYNEKTAKGKFSSFSDANRASLYACDNKSSGQYDRLPDRGLFSCVTCGILCFAGVAVIQPREAAARYLMSADCSSFDDWVVGSGNGSADVSEDDAAERISCSGLMGKNRADGLFDVPIQSADSIQRRDESVRVTSETRPSGETSALGLLALTYGDSSEDDDDRQAEEANNIDASSEEEHNSREFSPVSRLDSDDSRSPSPGRYNSDEDEDRLRESYDPYEEEEEHGRSRSQTIDCSVNYEANDLQMISDEMIGNASVLPRSDKDSSRMHVFCLHHAVEVEQQLRSIGGVNMLLLCHPDYPELESEAKSVAEEMGSHHAWSKIEYRDAEEDDKEKIQSAVESEEAVHANGDWAVKLGINLFYSASLSRSPLYSKQMPYNSIIYEAFGRSSPASTPTKPKGFGKHKKIVVAGKWCGKVWMSNQVHPLLVQRDPEEYYEPERNLSVPSKPNVNLERQLSQRTYSGGSGNKRKKVVEIRSSAVKAKYPKLEVDEDDYYYYDDDDDDEEEEEEEEPEEDEEEEQEPEVDEEEEEPIHEEEEPVQEEEEPVEEADSDDLLVNATPHFQYYRRDFRNKRAKTETPQPPERNIHNYDDDELEGGPSTRLRKRKPKPVVKEETISEPKSSIKKPIKKSRQSRSNTSTSSRSNTSTSNNNSKRSSRKGAGSVRAPSDEAMSEEEEEEEAEEEEEEEDGGGAFSCDMEGCNMSFASKHDLVLHKRNVCPVKGCGKKFFSHKYLVQHRRVHVDDRPLKCPWKGCRMTFKWAWARTEHIRVHTGARPYACTEDGCGQTFRFVSDFSRHKRKTGHSTKKGSKR